MSDPFQFKKPEILLSKDKLTEFWPTKYQSYEERINSITRFLLYAGTILSYHAKNTQHITMAILLIVVLVVLSNSKNKVLKRILKTREESSCQQPTKSNPLANQIPYGNLERNSACDSHLVEDKITQSIFAEFPTRSLGDKNKEYLERQFFSMPNTGLVNDQKGFASWLYGAPNKKMCKSNPEHCTGLEGRQNGAAGITFS